MSSDKVAEWVAAAARTWPEQVSLPDDLEEADLVELADASNRLRQTGQIVSAIRRQVDERLDTKLAGGALRYGEQVWRPASGRGKARLTVAEDEWWLFVLEGVAASTDPVGLISRLYNAGDLKLGGLGLLAKAKGMTLEAVKNTFIDYDPATSISVMPIHLAPKWTQKLTEGQFSASKPSKQPDPEEEADDAANYA